MKTKKVSKSEKLNKAFERAQKTGLARKYNGHVFKWSNAVVSVTTEFGYEHLDLVYWDIDMNSYVIVHEPSLKQGSLEDRIEFVNRSTSVKASYRCAKNVNKNAIIKEVKYDVMGANFNDALACIMVKRNKNTQDAVVKTIYTPNSRREDIVFSACVEYWNAIDKAIEESKKATA